LHDRRITIDYKNGKFDGSQFSVYKFGHFMSIMATNSNISQNEDHIQTSNYVCYDCGNDVEIDELLEVDEMIDQLPSSIAENFGSYYSHCARGDQYFHPNEILDAAGIVNICAKCYRKTVEMVKEHNLFIKKGRKKDLSH
jgi:hypothetical protein